VLVIQGKHLTERRPGTGPWPAHHTDLGNVPPTSGAPNPNTTSNTSTS